MAKRSGGREARLAARAAELPVKPVRPGQPGGNYKPLSDGQLQSVFDNALDILEELGMGSPIPTFVESMVGAGGWMDDNERLHYPRDLVLKAIESAAKDFVWHGLDEDRSVELKDQNVHFSTAGAAVLMLDHATKTFRESTSADLYDSARLADTLEHIHTYVRTVVARDADNARDLDIVTAYATMMGTTKPQGTSFFQPEHVYEVVDMYDMLLGEEGAFRKRPFVVANATFVVPPLRFAQDTAECMVAQVRTGMPINLLSAGQAGATSPASLSGSLVQAMAECLAALTSVNLLSPGHPCIFSMWPFVSDLRTGAMSGGSGEEALLNAGAGQLANWLGLPSGSAAGMADSKLPDAQAGHEKGLTVSLVAQAGTNVVYESAGMLAALLGHSLEMMVIDNDLLGAVNRTIRGIETDDYALARTVFDEVVKGEGHFLGHPQTLDLMEKHYVYPMIGDRLSPDDWKDDGATDASDRAHSYVTRTMSSHYPSHVSPQKDAQIRDAFNIILPPESVNGSDQRWRQEAR
ncbi:MAG: trimethylamine methyltransferase family protein [Acidimicrobiia bacterium]|nr:trimethylamine methyltransferase family protein [Acidimicrobiia bacterium]